MVDHDIEIKRLQHVHDLLGGRLIDVFTGNLRSTLLALVRLHRLNRQKRDIIRGEEIPPIPLPNVPSAGVGSLFLAIPLQNLTLTGGSLPAGGTIVCNGYKDAEYIRLALVAQRLGHRVFLVIEKLSELELIRRTASAMNIRPRLGLRVRLAAATAGNWQNTGGERSKFGFTAAGVLALLERLRTEDMLDCLAMLHCHPGSQITRIDVLRDALQEMARSWYEKAAAAGDVVALETLGLAYMNGDLGVQKNSERGRELLRRAADSGHHPARDRLDAMDGNEAKTN